MSQIRIIVMVAAFAVVSIYLVFTDDPGNGATEKRSQPEIVPVHVNDPGMTAAMAQARSSVGEFVAQMSTLRAAGASVSIKFPLTENGNTEHVWMGDPVFDGRQFSGYLASMPGNLPSWSHGDSVSVSADQISDWIAIDDGTLYGGFTIYVLRDRMSPEQRRTQDQRFGFALPDRPILWN